MKLNGKQKKMWKMVIIGQISLWSIFFMGVSILPFTNAKDDIILMLLWAGVILGLLTIFSIAFKQLPIKNIEDW